jgi:hypothetical protein
VQRRAGSGISISGSYTLSRCTGTATTAAFNQTSAGYPNPADSSFDAGHCDQDRTHLSTLSLGYEAPEVANAVARVLASHWRLSRILNARSGDRVNITSGLDNAFNGISAQRPNKIGDDLCGARTLTNYFDRTAFAQPAPGTLGSLTRSVAVGPTYWSIDLAISRLIQMGTRRFELRLESFNLLNHFNWGLPVANFNSGQFGRITTQAGAPRIMQFGVRYDF